jgi:hypothetical protein
MPSDPIIPSADAADRFNRRCAALGLLFLVLTLGGKYALYFARGLDQYQDFPQYYMGGVIALVGPADALYPVPRPDALSNPGMVEMSDARPAYARLADERGIGESYRFIQPPPAAVLYLPLAPFPAPLAHVLWMTLLTAATFAIALQAAKITTLCFGSATRVAGIVLLLVCLAPHAHRWVRVGNVSPLVGFLIGHTVLELLRRDGFRGGVSFTLAAILKYAVLVLAPLYLIRRRWKTIAAGTVAAAALGLASLAVLGVEPWRVFVHEIAPRLGRTGIVAENQALYAFLLRAQGLFREDAMPRAMELAFRIVQFGSLAVILGLVVLRRRAIATDAVPLLAASLALLGWLLIFSPIFWEHYYAYLAPFWGYLAWEATRSRPRAVVVALAFVLGYLPTSLVMQRMAAHFGIVARLPEPLFSHLLWATVLATLIATWRVWQSRDPRPASSMPARSDRDAPSAPAAGGSCG